jgi:hypothetical protein
MINVKQRLVSHDILIRQFRCKLKKDNLVDISIEFLNIMFAQR